MADKTPIWMTNEIKKEKKALKCLEKNQFDEAELGKIAVEAPLINVRIAALEKINSAGILKTIVCKAGDFTVSNTAFQKLDDKELLDVEFYLSLGHYMRMRTIDRVSENDMLFRILQHDNEGFRDKKEPSKNGTELLLERRLAAVDKINDDKYLVQLLDDNFFDVREKAFLKINDNEKVIQYISQACDKNKGPSHTAIIERLALLSDDEIENLLSLPQLSEEMVQNINAAICRKKGHVRGEKCRCIRCGIKIEHSFSENGICMYCSGKLETVTEDLIDTKYGQEYVFGKRITNNICYQDGTVEKLSETQDIDKGVWHYLYDE